MKGFIPDSLLFDLDGTLWDAVQTYAEAWNIFFQRYELGLNTSKNELDGLMGLEEARFLEHMLPRFSPKQRSLYYEEVVQIQYELIDKIGGHIYEGVVEGLSQLSEKYALFIVSNCPKYTIQHFMKFASVDDYISDSISHGQNYRPKHENIDLLVKNHVLTRPVYVGDTDGDRIQSEKAKVPFVFMEYGFGNCSEYYLKFTSFEKFTQFYMDL